MGKVRKLRKKYKALCSKTSHVPPQKSSVLSNSISRPGTSMSEALSSMIEDADHRSTARSTYSISKSIKSSLGGMSIQKKDKQKLRHELFLKRLNASKEAFDRLKKKKKEKVKQFNFEDNLPSLKISESNEDSRTLMRKQPPKIEIPVNKPRKGILKYRNQQLCHNVNQFREKLKTSSSYLNVANKNE